MTEKELSEEAEAIKEIINTEGAGVGPQISDDQAEFMATLQKREPLMPELKLWVDEDSVLGPFLKHPLCYIGLGNEEEGIYPFAAQANKAFKAKREALHKAIEERNWFVCVFVLYERPYRLYGFQKVMEEAEDQGEPLTDEEYWNLLGSIWTDSENIYQNEAEWHEYLHADRLNSHAMMEDDERTAMEHLPETLNVYRGFCVDGREAGYSWTIDKDRAIWFAKRLCRPKRGDVPRLASGRCRKEDALAYFTGRGEDEILILPENITDITIEEL